MFLNSLVVLYLATDIVSNVNYTQEPNQHYICIILKIRYLS